MTKIVLQHAPCPSCTSSDAYCEYDDGHGYCYSCENYFNLRTEDGSKKYSYEYIPTRGIERNTLAFYDVKTKIDEEGKPLSSGFFYPNGAAKVRLWDKKEFFWKKDEFDPSKAGLFGRDKFSAGASKSVIITEGEYDALSLYQVTRIPCVSVRSATTAARDCAVDRSWLNSFERVYIAFDGDAAGREASRLVARLFDYNKLYQINFSKRKDANDYLRHGEADELAALFHSSRRFLPDQIKSSFADFEVILDEAPKQGIPYPFKQLTDMTYGIRTGESVLITAQEGVGKTEFMHALEYQILKHTSPEVGVGAIFLEEPKRRHLQALAGIELHKPVHLADCGVTPSQMADAVQAAVGKDERLHIYSHFGTDDPDTLLDTIRFMVTARGCVYILLDHITMAVSGLAGEDERRALDYLSTRLEMMVKELDFALIFVSHVNDEGRTRGSRYISKIADMRIDLERDLIASDPKKRTETQLTVSKNRFCGKTGPAGVIVFHPDKYQYEEQFGVEEPESATGRQETAFKPANDNFPPQSDRNGQTAA